LPDSTKNCAQIHNPLFRMSP